MTDKAPPQDSRKHSERDEKSKGDPFSTLKLLESVGRAPTNLQIPLTPLIGRENERDAVTTFLLRKDVRLLTLTGPGGVGKTRLALQVAADLVDKFSDGVFFVPLASINDPKLVLPTISGTLGLREEHGRSPFDASATIAPKATERPLAALLENYLREKHVLLVLDNLEHLLTSGPQIIELLASCRKLKVLVTSRSTLNVRGEQEFSVPPLALPDLRRVTAAKTVLQYAAALLFFQRALAVNPDFKLMDKDAKTVAEICVRLDGLPLALELAAARTRVLSAKALLARLESRLSLLTAGPRDLPARQQTLRDTIAWSYDLLTPGEKTLFRRLGIFAGGCTLDAAEKVCSREQDLGMELVDGLQSLVDKSLISRVDMYSESQFMILHTIREFALERLEKSGEIKEIGRLHGHFFAEFARKAELELRGPQQAAWLERLERDNDNLREALRWFLQDGEADLCLEMAGSLWRYWWVRGRVAEGREWLSRALLKAPKHTLARARALRGAGALAALQNDHAAARALHEESLAIYQELGDRLGISTALLQLGTITHDQGDYASARSLYEQSLAMKRELGDRLGTAMLLNNLGIVAQQQGDHTEAKSLFEQSLLIKRELGDNLGVAISLYYLARVACQQADYLKARTLCQESLVIERDLGDKIGIADCLEGLAEVACRMKLPKQAAQLFGAAEIIRETYGAPIFSMDRGQHERIVAEARGMLAPKESEAAWAEGRAMTLEEAIAYALRKEI